MYYIFNVLDHIWLITKSYIFLILIKQIFSFFNVSNNLKEYKEKKNMTLKIVRSPNKVSLNTYFSVVKCGNYWLSLKLGVGLPHIALIVFNIIYVYVYMLYIDDIYCPLQLPTTTVTYCYIVIFIKGYIILYFFLEKNKKMRMTHHCQSELRLIVVLYWSTSFLIEVRDRLIK